MDALVQYTIPVSGLRNGMHQFDFEVDSDFFKHFEASPIQTGDVQVRLYFEKRPDLYVLTFDFEGTIQAECDRCLEEMKLKISGNDQLLVKFDTEASEDADIVYIPPGTQQLNVSKYVYEFICLSIPLIKTHDDSDEDCDPEMIRYLEMTNEPLPEEEETKEEDSTSIWDALKDFNKNN